MKNYLHPVAHGLAKLTALLLVVIFSLFTANPALGQCTPNSWAYGTTSVPISTQQSINTGSGTFNRFDVTAGLIYSFYYSSAESTTPADDWIMTLAEGSNPLTYDNINTPIPNDYFGGVACPTNTQVQSAEWYDANYTGYLNVGTNSYNGTGCNGYVAGQSSATLNYLECDPAPDPGPGVYPKWNVDAYATTALTIPNTKARYGYFPASAGLSFNSANYYAIGSVPSAATGWVGCTVPPENWCVRARTKGLSCGVYTFAVNYGDDSSAVYLNGNLVQAFPCCISNTITPAGNPAGYVITDTDVVEVRYTGVCGTNQVSLIITEVTPAALTAGTIGTNQTICAGSIPNPLTSGSGASGGYGPGYGNGSYTYEWYEEINCDTPAHDLGAGGAGYTFPVGGISNTVCVVRLVKDGCGNNTYTAPVTITVNQPSVAPGTPSATPSSLCVGGSSTLAITSGTLGTGASWVWYAGGCGSGSSVGTGSSISVSPLSTTTYYVRAEGPGPCTTTTGCASVTVTVNTPSTAPTSVTVGTTPICNNGSTTTLTEVGGALGSGATYEWYAGSCGAGVSVGTGSTITVTPAATTNYYVLASSAGTGYCPATSCASNTVTVNQPSVAPVSINASTTNLCNGLTDTLTVNGGSLGTNATWVWYAGGCGSGTSVGSGSSISVSPSGNTTYYVRAENTGVCPSPTNCASQTITVLPLSVAATGISGTDTVCHGNSTSLNVVGGSLGSGAIWNWYSGSCGGSFVGSGPSVNVTPLSNTAYYVRAAGTCNTTTCIDTTVIVNPLPSGYISGTTSICNGSSAVITFNFTVGTGPFNIVYTDGNSLYTLNGITNGATAVVSPVTNPSSATTTTYSFYSITDANGCIATSGFSGAAAITVTPLPIISSIDTTGVLCNGGSTGTITVNVTSGTAPIYYSIDTGGVFQTSNLFTGLAVDTYYVVVRDNQGCYSVDTPQVVINQPTPVTQIDTLVNASCSNVDDGSIRIIASGGIVPYTYSLNGGPVQSDSVFTGLSAGNYTIQVYSGRGCLDTADVTISNSYILGDSIVTETNVSCFGGDDGSVTVVLIGGTPPYTYSINGSIYQSTPTFNNLTAGNYVVILKDARGCTAYLPVTITQPAELSVNIDSTVNVLCNGTATGALFISVSGGTGPYTYVWSNGQHGPSDTDLIAGTYTVTVQDAHSCLTFASGTITQPQPLFTNIASYHNLNCFNDSSGSVLVTASGGVPPYSYLWSNGDTTQGISGLQAITYYITVTDKNGCTQVDSQALTQPVQLTSGISATNDSCYGSSNGTVTLTISGGTLNYSVLWSNGSTSQNLTGVPAGTYTADVTDAHGCTTSGSIVVTQPNPIVLAIAVTNVSCNAGTGSLNLTVTGGTPNYNYSWNNGAYTSQNLTGVGIGNYVVVVTDANLCSATDSATITQPAALTLSDTVINVTCNGAANGAIDLTIGGGVAPYSYAWSNGDTTQDINGLSGNATYTVVVTDANGCSITGSFTVNEPTALAVSLTGVNATCPGTNSGSASVSATGGTPPYSYLWSTFQTTDTLGGLAGGTYYVIVTDNNGCKNEDSVVISQPAPFVINISATNVACNGGSTGDVNLNVTGGTLNYSYSWNGGTYNSQNLTGVPAGTYVVVVTDAHGCTVTDSTTVTQPTALVLNGTVVNVACAGGHDGSVSITVNGGVFPYSYAWSNTDTTQNINGLNGGTYTVVVTDANGCSITGSFTVNEPTALTSTISGTNVTCPGQDNGTASVSASGGTQPYTYLWNTFQTGDSISGLAGGNYYVIVTDNNGCKNEDSIVITQPNPFVINISVTNVACNGGSTGDVNLNVTGGTGAYTYSWNGGTYNSQNLTGVPAGTYVVVVTDANGCTTTDSATVTQPTALVLNGTVVNVACAGGHDGSVSITVNGGVFPYSYAWSNTDTTQNINGLNGGTYTVVVTDANGCSITGSFTVNEPTALTSTISGTDVTCPGQDNGTASVSASGGTQPYTYLWNTFQTGDSISGLAGGNYYVIITDNNGCKNEDSITITQPAPFVLNISTTSIACNGGPTNITLSVTGGTPNYTYSWNNGTYTSQNLTGVAAGSYVVVVTDAHGCTATDSATVTQPTALVLNGTVVNVACAGGHDGSVSITVNGGVFPYSYAWSNTDTTQNINGLNGGTYTVVVTDANGCSITGSFTVNEPTPLANVMSSTNVTCPGENNGTASVSVTGGSQPYSYLWNTFQTTDTISGLAGGTYFVIITDNNGCKQEDSTVITQPQPWVLSISQTSVLCNGGSTGNVTLTVSGATGGYTYSWNNGAYTTQNLTGVPAGNYVVVVTDSKHCTITDSITVTQPAALAATGGVQNVHCAGGNDGAVDLTVTGGTTPYIYAWSNGDSLVNATNLPVGPIQVTVTDANLCSVSLAFNISEPTPITDTITGTGVSPCHGTDNGSAVMTVSGGTPPYTFLWSNFAASQNISGLSGGTYFVLITDSNGCTHRDSVRISEPALLTLSVSATNISCFNDSNGVITANVGGGNTPYNYQWSNVGAPDSSVDSHLTGGNYSVTVTDATGCSASATATVVNPPILVTNFVVHNDQCYGDTNGSISLIQSGGTPNYSFRWSNGDTTQDIAGLAADTFTVSVTDARGCTSIASAIVIQPSALYTSGVIKNVTCKNDGDGNVVITAYGGTLPYSYVWVDSTTGNEISTTQNIYGVSGGNYYVTVTDANTCFVVSQYIVLEPQLLTDTLVGTNVTCFGGNNGTAANIPHGGTKPYAYLWNDFVTDSARGSLTAGLYTVLLSDSNGCHLYDSIQITQPTAINIAAVVDSATCYGSATGSITTTVTGGTPTYTYLWSNAVTNPAVTAEDAGDYTVTATDNVGCTASASFDIGQPTQIYTTMLFDEPTCFAAHNGSVSVVAEQGVLPYTYNWSTTPAQTTASAAQLAAGTYTVTVTDANSCTVTATEALIQPDSIAVSTNVQTAKCFNTASGGVIANVTGGNGPYVYELNGQLQASDTFTGLVPGNYLLLVTDLNGCDGKGSFQVSAPASLAVTLSTTDQIILTGMQTQLVATATPDTGIVHYFWSPLTLDSVSIFDFSGCSDSTDCSSPLVSPPFSQIFTVTVENSDSCFVSDTITIIVDDQPALFIPTAFTPNGDGLNDKFEFAVLGANSIEISIFDRWGERVYYNPNQNTGMNNTDGWDGTFKGKPAPDGTYVYQLKITYFDGTVKNKAGTVAIIR